MFTGLIEQLGTVARLAPDGSGGASLAVACPPWAGSLALGESVSVSGTCLTVVADRPAGIDFQVGPETLARTSLGRLRDGDRVNLERSLRAGDRLGGHFVQGHVDGVGRVRSVATQGGWRVLWFDAPADLLPLMVPKGSVAVDGISLTLVDLDAGGFSVMLIPHTLDHTTLGAAGVGTPVNLEADMLAKHVRRLLEHRPTGS